MSWSIYDSPSFVRCSRHHRDPGAWLYRGPGSTWAAREARQRRPRPPRARVTPDARQRKLLRLLREGRTPAHVLAGTLGVSLRTLYRDIEALRTDGYAVLAVGGRRGGFWLAADCKPAPLDLPSDALREIVVGLAAAAQQGILPTTRDPRAFLEILLRTVPEQRARWLRRLCEGLLAEPRPIGLPASAFEGLERSVGESRVFAVTTDVGGKRRAMAVEPVRFELRPEGFVLSGWDRRREEDVEVHLSTVLGGHTGRTRVPRTEPKSRPRIRAENLARMARRASGTRTASTAETSVPPRGEAPGSAQRVENNSSVETSPSLPPKPPSLKST
ncbi:MAG: HTH domain-containing protein [Alphaproteobacteria bacterium]|nr:HTH domain-containing protein [Alphaproteobacteria bacterium]